MRLKNNERRKKGKRRKNGKRTYVDQSTNLGVRINLLEESPGLKIVADLR